MMMWRRGTVVEFKASWSQASEWIVRTDDGREVRALAYEPQVGRPEIGDVVLLSAAAFERGLGTGGYMMIVAIPERLPADPPPAPGHIVKARYTPMQFMVQGVDEQESDHHDLLAEASSIDGMPVIVADLHSALPAIVLGIRDSDPEATIAYVMTDGGALPAWFSQAAFRLREDGLIRGTITCGQAYGGDVEAVNVHTALLAAGHVWNADVAIVIQGPGNLGTGTRWGFSGVAVGEAINAAGVLGGQPIAALRLSNGDLRERHYGISHHSIRALRDVALRPFAAVVPTSSPDYDALLPAGFHDVVASQLNELRENSVCELVDVATSGLVDILRDSPVALRTMGRGLDTDASSFVAAAAAGRYAGSLTRSM